MKKETQEPITYTRLQLSCSLAVKTILDFQITEKPGEHARGTFRVRLHAEDEKDRKDSYEPLILWELDEKGNRKREPLFAGYPQETIISCQDGYREAEITVLSGTILLDEQKRNRAFQSPDQGILEIADRIVKDTDHAAFILNGPDRDAGGTAIQYDETDWEFLKRLASRCNLPLVADSSYYFPRFYIGMPHGEDRELPKMQDYIFRFHRKYYEIGERCTVERKDFICYDITTSEKFDLGDHVFFEERRLVVSEKEMKLQRGEIQFRYLLTGESFNAVPRQDNKDFTGMSFQGEVISTKGEEVVTALDIDKEGSTGNAYGYAPKSGNLMYCMPQKGTKVSLYLGNGREQEGIVTDCIHTNSEDCEEMGSPQNKSFRSEHGNGIDLYPESMGVNSNGGNLRMSDGKGIDLDSVGELLIQAAKGIRFESGKEIHIQAVSQIAGMVPPQNTSALLNGNLDFQGQNTVVAGTSYCNFDAFDDAPEEGEFDWDGFMTNLAMGVLATAVLGGLAAFTIATGGAGGVLAGALLGGAMGTLSATITGAIGELKSGNVRSTGEVIRDLAVSGISGAVTGAIGVKLPEKEGIANCLIEGFANSGGSTLERAIAAIADKDMSWTDKKKYIFDIKQMGIDFGVGMGIGHAVNKINARKPGGKPKEGIDLKDGSSPKSGIELEDGSKAKNGSKKKNDSKFKDVTEFAYDVGTENDGKSKKGGKPQNGSKPKNGNSDKPKNGKSNKGESNTLKSMDVFKDVDENTLKNTVRKHIFSDKHIKSGIMDLGKNQDDILNRGIAIIKEIASKNKLVEGSTQIKTHINGLEVEIRIFIKDGKIINFDMFKGWSPRDMGNVIYY